MKIAMEIAQNALSDVQLKAMKKKKIKLRENYMLKVENLSYSVEQNGNTKQILKDISFECDCKNLVITGHNGSGKSTLLKLLMGILPVSHGKIFFDGQDITNLSITDRAKLGLAFAFQTPICFKGLTVKKLLQIASQKSEKDIQVYCDILSKLGMCARDYIDREVSSKLSGGEQKRIEIATVVARDAKLNLFDEPEAGIDIWSFDGLLNVFDGTKGKNIIVSHQKKLMEKADKILVLSGGEVTLFGDTKDILPQLEKNSYCEKLSKGGDK